MMIIFAIRKSDFMTDVKVVAAYPTLQMAQAHEFDNGLGGTELIPDWVKQDGVGQWVSATTANAQSYTIESVQVTFDAAQLEKHPELDASDVATPLVKPTDAGVLKDWLNGDVDTETMGQFVQRAGRAATVPLPGVKPSPTVRRNPK